MYEKAIYLVYYESIRIFKEYNLKRDFSTKYLAKYNLFSPKEMKFEEKIKNRFARATKYF